MSLDRGSHSARQAERATGTYAAMRNAVRGMCFSVLNDVDEFLFLRDEVLPRLERMGLREKPSAA